MNDRRVIVERAEREGIKSRIALIAPTGYGKTWTALSLATEMQGDKPILGIDTERRSMGLYGHVKTCPADCHNERHFTFQWLPWDPPYDPAELTAFLEAESHRYGVIILDSFSHFWKGEGGTIDAVDNIAKRQASGGGRADSFAAWKEGGTLQDKLIGAILGAECHVICCFRVKMTYERQEVEERGRKQTKIVKLGLNPIQRDDVEYEFTVIAEMDREHHMVITKTRCDDLDRQVYAAGEQRKMARTLLDWLGESRDAAIDRLEVTPAEARARVLVALEKLDKQRLRAVIGDAGYPGGGIPVGAWLETRPTAVLLLVGALRLPLNVVEELPPDDEPDSEPEPVEVTKPEEGGKGEGEITHDTPLTNLSKAYVAASGQLPGSIDQPVTGSGAVLLSCHRCEHQARDHLDGSHCARDGCDCPSFDMSVVAQQALLAEPEPANPF